MPLAVAYRTRRTRDLQTRAPVAHPDGARLTPRAARQIARERRELRRVRWPQRKPELDAVRLPV